MGKFINHEQGFAFEDSEGYQIPLNQDNYWVWLHREEPLKDMAQVEDDRDGLSWYFFRYDHAESFDQLDMMARKVGVVVLRSFPMETIETVFENQHQLTDDDFNALLDGSDEPRD